MRKQSHHGCPPAPPAPDTPPPMFQCLFYGKETSEFSLLSLPLPLPVIQDTKKTQKNGSKDPTEVNNSLFKTNGVAYSCQILCIPRIPDISHCLVVAMSLQDAAASSPFHSISPPLALLPLLRLIPTPLPFASVFRPHPFLSARLPGAEEQL